MTKYPILILFLIAVSIVNPVFSQVCGTVISLEDATEISERSDLMRGFNARSTRGIRDFPVQIHIVRRSDGTGGISWTDVEESIRNVNRYFINANVRFVLLDKANYIDNSAHFNFNTRNEKSLALLHDEPQVVNLYLFNSIEDGGQQLCGYAHYPNQLSYKRNNDRILMRNSCIVNGSTLVHEFGHFFSLFHTHGNPQVGTAKELVTRHNDLQNCDTAGDGLCDTAADPGLYDMVDNYCNYTGTKRDAMGYKYQPDPTNIMAYSQQECRDQLTQEQYNRINYVAHHWRSYLKFPKDIEQSVALAAPVPAPTSEIRPARSKISGELMLEISGQKMPILLSGNVFKGTQTYYSGTTYELSVVNDEEVFVYVFASDLTRQNYLLYPKQGNSAYLTSKSKKVMLPGNGELFAMDETVGKDYLCVLYSRRPVDIGAVLRRMQYERGNFIQRLYQTMGNELVRSSQIKYSRNGKIQFFANTTERDVVPIIVELDHQ